MPELEEILNEIGWQHVKSLPTFLSSRAEATLTPEGGWYAPKQSRTRELLPTIDELYGHIEETIKSLDRLTPKMMTTIDVSSATEDERKALNWPARTAAARAALEAIVPGIFALYDFLEWEAGEAKPGAPKHRAAYSVARVLAEIYVVGLGAKPMYGTSHDDWSKPTGRFGRVAVKVFRQLNIVVKDPRPPCREAIDALDSGKMSMLLGLRNLPTTERLRRDLLGRQR